MDNNNNFVDANSTQSNENSNNTRLNSTFQAKHPNNFTKTKTTSKSNKSGNSSFGKSVLIPFVSGVLGASLVVGICFNVPSIKNNLVGSTNYPENTDSSSIIDYNNVNTNLISLSSFSDTGVAVAQKVLPSVVGIKVIITLLILVVLRLHQVLSISLAKLLKYQYFYIMTQLNMKLR